MSNKQSDGKPKSGMDVVLKPGEKLYIKDTDYIIRNKGQFTVSLHLYTREYEAWMQVQAKERKMHEVLPGANPAQGRRYWVKIKGEKGE